MSYLGVTCMGQMSYLGVTCMGLLGPNVLLGCDLHGTAWTESLNLGVTCMGLLGPNVLTCV